jgi:hypothetical protein
MENVCSPFYFHYICVMKEVIYKKNFEKFTTSNHKNYTNILPSIDDEKHYGINSIFNVSEKHPLFISEGEVYGEENYNENVFNQMCSVLKEYVMIVVEKNGEKVVIKLFHGFRHRMVGKAWFKVEKNVDYISVNTKTGDVYSGHLRGYQKKKKFSKSIKRNAFYLEPLESLKSKLKNILTRFTNNSYDEVSIAFSEFLFHIDQRKNFEKLNFSERLFRFYLDKKNYKYPNNFRIFPNQLVGPEIKKILKKNDNKLIDAIMIKHGLSGKKIKQALHVCDKLNLELYKSAKKLFGDDWLNQDKENIILDLLNSSTNIMLGALNFPRLFSELISKEELKRVYNLFKQVYVYQNLDSYTFHDHIRMYTELKMFGERDLKWYSVESKEEFSKEHLDWTDKLQHYKMGTYKRHYPEYMYEKISKPIFNEYYPILLDSSKSYNDESNFQSNCVKGYIGKSSSLIISVRKNDERATIEYKLYLENNRVKVSRIQTLGKYNQKLNESWNPILLNLDSTVLSCVKDERFETVKLTKECRNGTTLKSDSFWDEQGNLRWTHKNIDSNYSLYINNIEI